MTTNLTLDEHLLPVMDVNDVADRLRLSPSSVRRLVASGALSHHRVGGLLRFNSEDLQAFTRRTLVTSAS
jgi:excisionase family DNA binding protein